MTVWSKDCTVISYTKARQVDLHHSAAVFNITVEKVTNKWYT